MNNDKRVYYLVVISNLGDFREFANRYLQIVIHKTTLSDMINDPEKFDEVVALYNRSVARYLELQFYPQYVSALYLDDVSKTLIFELEKFATVVLECYDEIYNSRKKHRVKD